MKLLDINVWLAHSFVAHAHHQIVDEWFARQNALAEIAFCRFTQHSMLRLITTASVARLYGFAPSTNEAAWSWYVNRTADPRITFLEEPAGLEAEWKQFSSVKTISPKLWPDAYLAAFAKASGCDLVTCDQGFLQYPGIKLDLLRNP